MQVFVDSDVIIASLLSSSGAAYKLLYTDFLIPTISSLSKKELDVVVTRLGIDSNDFERLLHERLKIIPLSLSGMALKKFEKYVRDIYDAHIVAGAKEAHVRFLITYNVKDYKMEKIKDDFSIIIITPGQFLQYLRSLK